MGQSCQSHARFAFKRFDGVVPQYDALTEADEAIIAKTEAGFESIGALLDAVQLKEALEETLSLARAVNGWLNEREPWKTLKPDPADAARSVYTALRCIDNLKILFAPFVPYSSQQVLRDARLRRPALRGLGYRELQRINARSSGAGL